MESSQANLLEPLAQARPAVLTPPVTVTDGPAAHPAPWGDAPWMARRDFRAKARSVGQGTFAQIPNPPRSLLSEPHLTLSEKTALTHLPSAPHRQDLKKVPFLTGSVSEGESQERTESLISTALKPHRPVFTGTPQGARHSV